MGLFNEQELINIRDKNNENRQREAMSLDEESSAKREVWEIIEYTLGIFVEAAKEFPKYVENAGKKFEQKKIIGKHFWRFDKLSIPYFTLKEKLEIAPVYGLLKHPHDREPDLVVTFSGDLYFIYYEYDYLNGRRKTDIILEFIPADLDNFLQIAFERMFDILESNGDRSFLRSSIFINSTFSSYISSLYKFIRSFCYEIEKISCTDDAGLYWRRKLNKEEIQKNIKEYFKSLLSC